MSPVPGTTSIYPSLMFHFASPPLRDNQALRSLPLNNTRASFGAGHIGISSFVFFVFLEDFAPARLSAPTVAPVRRNFRLCIFRTPQTVFSFQFSVSFA